MLLVLEPLPHILFSIVKRICPVPLAFTFYIFPFVGISVLVDCFSFTIWFSAFQFSGIFAPVFKSIIPDFYLAVANVLTDAKSNNIYTYFFIGSLLIIDKIYAKDTIFYLWT